MKAWQKQKPTMKSAAIMKATREQLWKDLLAHPEWSHVQVNKISGLIARLNKQIANRSLDDAGVAGLLKEIKVYSRNYKRIAARKKKTTQPKLSVRSIKFILKQVRNEKGKTKKETSPKEANHSSCTTGQIGFIDGGFSY